MNVQTENGFTMLANELYEATFTLPISGRELRVLHCIIRLTYGYKKKEDRIPLSKISELTKIAIPHISKLVSNLIKYGIVTNLGNSLGINKDYSAWKVTNLGNSKKVTNLGNKKLPKTVTHRYIKEKKESNISKDILGDKSPKEDNITYGNEQINKIILDFKTLTGRIPSDPKPRQVAQNINQITNTFLRDYSNLFLELRGYSLTREYVFERFYQYLQQKKYAFDIEKLLTVKLKMRVYLDEVAEALKREKRQHDEKKIYGLMPGKENYQTCPEENYLRVN